jgi:hypothetical protein
MKRLLRQTQTGLYFNRGRWVKDWARAEHFPDTVTAIKTAARHHLRGVQLVVQDGEGDPLALYDMRLFAQWVDEDRV